jgi:hypothetical protein
VVDGKGMSDKANQAMNKDLGMVENAQSIRTDMRQGMTSADPSKKASIAAEIA